MLHQNELEDATVLQARGVDLVRKELEAHGLGKEMWMLEGVVPAKRSHPRLAEAHSKMPKVLGLSSFTVESRPYAELKRQPVLDVEILAGLLYTGTDAQGQIRKALREATSNTDTETACGWRWTLTALRHLIAKLAEDPPERLYHGLNNVRPPSTDSLWGSGWASYNNVVSGSMALEVAKIFAKGEGGTVVNAKHFGTVFHFNLEKSNETYPAMLCADVRWLSKFADEREWLMIPLSTYGGVKLGQSRSEPLPSGGELIHQECWWSCSGVGV